MLRTGGLRALGLTLSPSANVFKLPDMTAWGGVFQGSLRCFDLTKIVTPSVFFQQKQNGKNRTCFMFFSRKKKNVQKELKKLKEKYTKGGSLFLQDVNAEFKFEKPDFE